jgi:hypothetical protein
MTWLKAVLFVFWIGWLGLVAVVSPPQTLLETIGLVLFSALIMVIAYWFYSGAFRAVARKLRGPPRE